MLQIHEIKHLDNVPVSLETSFLLEMTHKYIKMIHIVSPKHGSDCQLCLLSDLMGLKRMMEKLGVPKTHLELKKMIVEVTGGSSNTINYRDFVKMMLGKRSAVLKL